MWAYSPADVSAYIQKYKDIALKNEKEFGIPATIILAQGILESGAGNSELTRASNNHFGIKAGSSWKGPVHYAWDDETQKSRFRSYSRAEESFNDHARLLTNLSVYRPLFNINIYDYRGWAHGLKRAGYASAPDYAPALIGIIDRYRLYEINGGVKLRPGKSVVITRYVDVVTPVFEEDCVMEESEETEEEKLVEAASRNYAVLINDVHCTVLQPGENLASISRKFDISLSNLLKYNDVGSESAIKEGDIVFLTKKKKKFEGARDIYVVEKGETLHDVSQKFGVQLREIAKRNGLNEYSRLHEGQRINLK